MQLCIFNYSKSKYLIAYINLVKYRQSNPVDRKIAYSEKHHIIPASLGGGAGKNIIRLTAREHFLAHYMLMRITEAHTGHYAKMLRAFHMMNSALKEGKRYVNSRLYARARVEFATMQSEKVSGDKGPTYGKVWMTNLETWEKRCVEANSKGVPNEVWAKGKIYAKTFTNITLDTKQKLKLIRKKNQNNKLIGTLCDKMLLTLTNLKRAAPCKNKQKRCTLEKEGDGKILKKRYVRKFTAVLTTLEENYDNKTLEELISFLVDHGNNKNLLKSLFEAIYLKIVTGSYRSMYELVLMHKIKLTDVRCMQLARVYLGMERFSKIKEKFHENRKLKSLERSKVQNLICDTKNKQAAEFLTGLKAGNYYRLKDFAADVGCSENTLRRLLDLYGDSVERNKVFEIMRERAIKKRNLNPPMLGKHKYGVGEIADLKRVYEESVHTSTRKIAYTEKTTKGIIEGKIRAYKRIAGIS